MTSVADLLKKLGITPNNLEHYYPAFTHKSFSNEKRHADSYQRLEFFGDAILNKLSSERIFNKYKKFDEGKMTIIKWNSVNGKQLAQFALELGFDDVIRFGNNSEQLKTHEKILEDVFEAFVAALYLDKGEDEVKKFLSGNVFRFIDSDREKNHVSPKTVLQEFLQSESREAIEYITEESGNQEFVSRVLHDGNTFGEGKGKTKKEAETNAAENALKLLGRGK